MKKAALSIIALFAVTGTFAQAPKHIKKLNVGISFAVNYSQLSLSSYDHIQVKQFRASNGPGFSLGLTGEYSFTKRLSIVVLAELPFYTGKVAITRIDNTIERYDLSPMVGLSLCAKYVVRNSGLRPYVLAGPAYQLPLNTRGGTWLPYATTAACVGTGAEWRLPKVTIAPELRYSFGLNSVGPDATANTRLNTLALIVHLKGAK